MYLLDFINTVRQAQGRQSLVRIPNGTDPATSRLEDAMGCELEAGLMRFPAPDKASAVSASTGLPVGVDRVSIALPTPLRAGPGILEGARPADRRPLATTDAV